MPVRPRRRRPTPEEIAQQQRQPAPPYLPGFQDHGRFDRFDHPPPGATITPRGRHVSPVAFDPATGMIIPPNSPGGFYPPGFVPGPTPGTMVRPGSPAMTRGYRNIPVPAVPDSEPVPIPGYEPGMVVPPPGAVPGPDPGTYIIPGEPGSMGDYRGQGRTPGTAAQGPFPIDRSGTVVYGPETPAGHPSAIFRDISPFPRPPDPQTVDDYHKRHTASGPYIDPYQMYDYEEVTADDVADVGGPFDIAAKKAAGKKIATQRIIDSYKQNQLDPWLDEAIFLGMADLVQGLTPTTVHVPAQPPVVRTIPGSNIPIPNPFDPGKPLMTKGTPATTEMGLPPLLDPANYPSGGGGIPGIPPLSDILGEIGDALLPSFEPVPLGGISPQAPSMPRDLAPAAQTPTARPPFVGGY